MVSETPTPSVLETALLTNGIALSEAEAWFTPAEIAELRLPGLPADKRSINRRANEER